MRNPMPLSGPKPLRSRPVIRPLDPKVQEVLARFATFLTAAENILGKNIPLRLIQAFIDVGEHPDTTRGEMAERVDMPETTASQDLRTLSVERRDGSPGLGLIEARWDAEDVRILRYRATPRGQVALARLTAARAN
jgi:DNA-binding MarR family transcriptional regulator